jgi:hypothetical protein
MNGDALITRVHKRNRQLLLGEQAISRLSLQRQLNGGEEGAKPCGAGCGPAGTSDAIFLAESESVAGPYSKE